MTKPANPAAKEKKVFKDPARQKIQDNKSELAQNKKEFNKAISLFNKELKKLKNEIHGNIEGKDRVHLDEKLPADLPARFNQLAEYFNQQAAKASKLVDEQAKISDESNRYFTLLNKKRQERREKAQKPEAAKMAKQIDYNLVAEAISPFSLSLLKTKTLLPWLEKKERLRIKMLDRLFKLDRSYSALESSVLDLPKDEGFSKIKLPFMNLVDSSRSVKEIIKQDIDNLSRGLEDGYSYNSGSKPESSSKSLSDSDLEKIIELVLSDVEYCTRLQGVMNEISGRTLNFDDANALKQEIFNLAIGLQSDKPISTFKVDELVTKYYKLINQIQAYSDFNFWVGSLSSYSFFKNSFNKLKKDKKVKNASLDENDVYDPVWTKTKKKIERYFTLDPDSQIVYDSLRDSREKLDELINYIRYDAELGLDAKSKVDEIFNTIEDNNKEIQMRLNLLRSQYEGLPEKTVTQLEEQVRRRSLRDIIRQFTKDKPNSQKAK